MQELPCGHFMHSHCFAQYTRFNYSCPVCSKSMGDMSIYFGMLDSIVARDLAGLPSAYQMRQQVRLSTTSHSLQLSLLCLFQQTPWSGTCAGAVQAALRCTSGQDPLCTLCATLDVYCYILLRPCKMRQQAFRWRYSW